MDREFNFLKKRYGLKTVKLYCDPKFLEKKGIEAYFNYVLNEIIIRDKRVCRRRLQSLLHEIRHAIQFKEKRLVTGRRNLRQMYEQEFEAEIFAIEEYEKLFSKKYGTCLNEPWSLASYDEYREFFKIYAGPGYGDIR